MSLNIITVMLNMEKYNFLGISIVGQSNDRGDGGIYIGSIMKGGAVASDERIQPGDMLLQVNEVSFEQMSNDEAVRVLREVVHKPGPITLTVAKCWDPQPRGCFTLPRSEPVRPIDPAAWVSHTAAMTACLTPHYSLQEESHLSIHSDMAAIAKTMADPESGLEVRDRMWLKITIPNAFIGSDVVDWLHHRVEGFSDRREARKYAGNLLKAGHIRHTVNKVTFSEQCYYIFGDICPDGLSSLVEAPLHQSPSPGCQLLTVFPYQFPVPHPYSPPPLPRPPPSLPGHGGETGSHNGEGGPTGGPTGSPSGGSHCSGPAGGAAGGDSASFRQEVSVPPPAALPSQDHHLSSPPPELTGSRQSFRIAVGNPSECFVDVM